MTPTTELGLTKTVASGADAKTRRRAAAPTSQPPLDVTPLEPLRPPVASRGAPNAACNSFGSARAPTTNSLSVA
eukprot:1186123-Lingulodinium_polyedra.AAC.1